MQNVLVAGATGYIGRFAVEAFKKQGYQVRALARDAAKLEPVKDYIDETVIAEVTEPKTLSGITRNIEIVFSSLGLKRSIHWPTSITNDMTWKSCSMASINSKRSPFT